MMYHIPDVLSTDQVAEFTRQLAQAEQGFSAAPGFGMLGAALPVAVAAAQCAAPQRHGAVLVNALDAADSGTDPAEI